MKIILQNLPNTRSLKSSKTEIKHTMTQNRLLVLLGTVLLGGLVCGALLAGQAGISALQKLDFLFNSNYILRSGTSALSVFLASVCSSFLFVFADFLCGLSVWGTFLVPFVPFIRGIGLGMTAGYLYVTHGFYGGLFYAVVLLPGAFFSCLAILWSAKEALLFSHRLSRAGLSEKGEPPNFLNYLSQFVRVLVLVFLGAGADTLFSWAFAKSMISLL